MLQGKIAWVTGAGTGIGLSAAQELAAAGAMVVMSGRRPEVLEHEAEAIRQQGGQVEAEALDVRDAAAVERVAGTIAARHGRVDVMVNSAGVNVANRTLRDQTVEGWDEVVRINLDGTYYCVRVALPLMRAQKSGVIINVSSRAGIYTSLLTGAAYSSSKRGVVSLTETINMEECMNGIRACVICPGEVATPIHDRRPVPPSEEERARMLQSEDLGRAIRWVAEQPPRVCINEIIINPTWNRLYAK